MPGRFIFSDVNRHYPDGDILNVDIAAINQSIENIITTIPGEIPWSMVGSNVYALLMEKISEDTARDIYSEIDGAISEWETRIRLLTAESYVVPLYDDNTYDVRLVYEIINFTYNASYQKLLPTTQLYL